MAAASGDTRYRGYATSGSSALELDWEAYRQELERMGELPRRDRRTADRPRTRVPEYGVSPGREPFQRRETQYISSPGRRRDVFPPPAWEPEYESPSRRRTAEEAEAPRRRKTVETAETPRRREAGRRVKTRRKERARPFAGVIAGAKALGLWLKRLPLLYVAGGALAALLAVQMLMSCIALTRLSSETVELKAALDTLKEENVTLSTEYDRMFDLTTVEAAAVSAGMTKPSRSQVVYVNLSGGDTAFVYREADPGFLGSIAERALEGFGAVREFFD